MTNRMNLIIEDDYDKILNYLFSLNENFKKERKFSAYDIAINDVELISRYGDIQGKFFCTNLLANEKFEFNFSLSFLDIESKGQFCLFGFTSKEINFVLNLFRILVEEFIEEDK